MASRVGLIRRAGTDQRLGAWVRPIPPSLRRQNRRMVGSWYGDLAWEVRNETAVLVWWRLRARSRAMSGAWHSGLSIDGEVAPQLL